MDDDTHERHTDTNKLTRHTASGLPHILSGRTHHSGNGGPISGGSRAGLGQARVVSLLQAMELDAASYGVRYPRGGFGRVRRRLLEQCEKVGVRVRTGAGVSVFGCIGTRLDDTACSNPDLLHAASRLISGCFRPISQAWPSRESRSPRRAGRRARAALLRRAFGSSTAMAPSRASPPTSCGPPAEIAPEIASRDCARDRSLPEARACGED